MDVLNLVLDLTRRPPSPVTYLNQVTELVSAAKDLGYRVRPVALVSGESSELELQLKAHGLGNALCVETDGAWSTAADALSHGTVLLVGSGAYVSPSWVAMAKEGLESGEPDRVMVPEIGVFNWRGQVTAFSFLRKPASRFYSPALRLVEFPPIAFGRTDKMKELLRAGVFSSDPFSRTAWLASWLHREALHAVPRSCFFMDADLGPLAWEGAIKQTPSRGCEPWLLEGLRELGKNDPRIPAAGLPTDSRIHAILTSGEEQELEYIVAELPRNPALVLVAVLSHEIYSKPQRLLIESAAESLGAAEICILVPDSEVLSTETLGAATLKFIGIERLTRGSFGPIQARALLAAVVASGARRIHLFESGITSELCRVAGSCGLPKGTVSATVLPWKDWSAPLERELIAPQRQEEAADVSFLFFTEGHSLQKALEAYGGARSRTCPTWAASEWRSEVLGDEGAVPARYTSRDSGISLALDRWPSQGNRWDWLGLQEQLEGFGYGGEGFQVPIPNGFLSMYRTLPDLPRSKFFLARDGALSLSLFFERFASPVGYPGTLLIHEALGGLVPAAWRSSVRSYRLRSMSPRVEKPRRLVLYGLAHPAICPIAALETGLNRLKTKLEVSGARPESLSLELYFPHVYSGWGLEPGSTYSADFVRAIRAAFSTPTRWSIRWLDENGFQSLAADDATVFHELGLPLYSSLSALRWSLLSRGFTELGEPAALPDAREGIALSPWHVIELHEPQETPGPELTELCAPIARNHEFASLLERIGQP